MLEQEMDSFWSACAQGDLPRVRELRGSLGGKMDQPNARGWTGLIMACHGEHHDVAKYLVEEGADVNAANGKGTTVFMYAKTPVANSKDTSLLSWLLGAGARINAEDNSGKTALDYVLENGDEFLARFLRRNGALAGTGKGTEKEAGAVD